MHITLDDGYTTCDIYDAHGDNLAVCCEQLHSFGGKKSASGPVRLVRCYSDNSMVKRLLATQGDGAILVVDGGNSLQHALLGDMIAQSAIDCGWRGVIVFGAVRDVEVLATLPLHVKALGHVPRKSHRVDQGVELDTLYCAGIWWNRGDWIYSDAEGLVVSRKQLHR